VSGVQSIERAASVLWALARADPQNSRLSDVAEATGLGKGTVHRLLRTLVGIGFARQDPGSKGYGLGLGLFALGRTAEQRLDIFHLARPALLRLAAKTGDTVFLSVRDRLESVCIDRREGDFPIKTLTLDVGARRPLGVGAGSLALLAFLSDDQAQAIIDSLGSMLDAYPEFNPAMLHGLVAESRRQGYAFNQGRVVVGMSAVGVPVRGPEGDVVASLSVAAISERMGDDRRREIVEALQEEADRLGGVGLSAANGKRRRRQAGV
jgi:DNA-binding IclR family transcriptional regulator